MSQDEFNFNGPPKKPASEAPTELLDRIKKLMRLSESNNPHEAALAMQRAMDLADRHNLDLGSLDCDEEVGHLIHRWFPIGTRMSRERRLALGIVMTYFHVDTCYSRGKGEVVLVGTESDVVIAEYILAFLHRTSRDCLSAYEAREKRARRRAGGLKRANFLAGFFYGISHQLSKGRKAILLEDAKYALILADQEKARETELASVIGPMQQIVVRKTRRNSSALMKGFLEGESTRISPALQSGKNHLQLA